MEPNNEQGIQLEYLSNLDIQQTNEWLDSITVEQIEELYDQPFDGEIYSKLLNLPAIEDPKGHTSMLLFGGMHSPMEIFEAFLEKNCQFVTCHLLMAIIMLDKGPKGIVKTPEQEQKFFEIFKKIKDLDSKVQKLYTLDYIFIKKYHGNDLGPHHIKRDFVFALDALFMHSVNFVEELALFEQSLPEWWKINKLVIHSKSYLDECIAMSAGAIHMDFHFGDIVSDYYQERFGASSPTPNQSNFEYFNRAVMALKSIQVCPDVLKLFPNLRGICVAKPNSANKKAHQELMAKIREENLVDFYCLGFKGL